MRLRGVVRCTLRLVISRHASVLEFRIRLLGIVLNLLNVDVSHQVLNVV